MNPEKNNQNVTEEPTPKKADKNQPVVVYIMILFIAAFLLMALSSLMHQRSNSEALGQLQSSVSNMQAVQATQDQIIDLQRQLSDAEDVQDELNQQIEDLEEQIAEGEAAAAEQQRHTEAMLGLYSLQQNYLTENYDACMEILQYMEDMELVELLPDKALDDATAPAARYQQLREAVLNK